MKDFFDKSDAVRVFGLEILAFALFSILAAFWQSDVVSVLYNAAIGGVALIYAAAAKRKFSAFTLGRKTSPLHFVMIVAVTLPLVFAMLPVNEFFLNVLEGWGVKRPETNLPFTDSFGVVAVLALCILPAFSEEIAFRGVIASGLRRDYGTTTAVLLSGAMFSLFHMNAAQTLHQFLFGCLLALFVLRSGSVWVGVVGHFCNNLLALILGFFVENTEFYAKYGIYFAIAGAILAIAMLVLYVKKVPAFRQKPATGKKRFSLFDSVVLVLSLAVCITMWIAGLLV